MDPETMTRILADMEAFEAMRGEELDLRAKRTATHLAFLLRVADPTSGETRRVREDLRICHTQLWARLFAAIDVKRNPAYDPHDPHWRPRARVRLLPDEVMRSEDPSIPYIVNMYGNPNPAAREKYESRRAKVRERNEYLRQQLAVWHIDKNVTPWAEEYFTTAFVRSRRSVRIVEAHTETLSKERQAQILRWVTPESE